MHERIVICPGTGDLFWAGGMRRVQEAAKGSGANFQLWLNDDVVLDKSAIAKLLEVYREEWRYGASR